MSLSFYQVAEVFQAIEHIASRLEMTQNLAQLYKKATPREAQIITYISLGTLFPPYKTMQFNIAKKSMLAILQQLSGPHEDVQNQLKQVGDLGAVWYEISDKILQVDVEQRDMTLLVDVYKVLQDCAQLQGTGSVQKRAEVVAQLLRTLDPISGKFIIRIITKTLRLGFSDMTIIDALSWMQTQDKGLRPPLEHAYNMCADLGKVAYTLKQDGIEGIMHVQSQVGIPLRPSAAERLHTAQAIIDKLGMCAAQSKLDGFRLQVHVYTDDQGRKKVAFFSRNLQDMSAMFPDLKHAFLQLPVSNLICEGEAIVYDENQEVFLPFQQTVKRKRKHDIEQASQDMPLRFYAFDILYMDGVLQFEKPHIERRNVLTRLFNGRMQQQGLFAIDETIVDSAQHLEHVFYQAMNAGLEGLVVKRLDAPYVPGKRNFNWVKYKREETQQIDDTLDVVILGYYHGSGKRAQFGIGAFLVGVYNPEEDQFESFAKIGTGLSDVAWRELKRKCDVYQVSDQPKNTVIPAELAPDVWVYPAIVCVVRADEITRSPVHAAGKRENELGYALRFPRFIEYRDDKTAQDATTIHEVEHLYAEQFAK